MKRGPANSCVVHASCNLHVIVLGASLEKGMAIVKHGIHVSSRFNQSSSPSPTSFLSAKVKRGPAIVLFGIHISSHIDQGMCDLKVALNAEEKRSAS